MKKLMVGIFLIALTLTAFTEANENLQYQRCSILKSRQASDELIFIGNAVYVQEKDEYQIQSEEITFVTMKDVENNHGFFFNGKKLKSKFINEKAYINKGSFKGNTVKTFLTPALITGAFALAGLTPLGLGLGALYLYNDTSYDMIIDGSGSAFLKRHVLKKLIKESCPN